MVHLILEDGSSYAETGRLTVTDVVVSESTGTFSIRATFPNPNRVLLPGMFVRATVDLGSDPQAFLVPQRAVTFNAAGEASALFAENGKAVDACAHDGRQQGQRLAGDRRDQRRRSSDRRRVAEGERWRGGQAAGSDDRRRRRNSPDHRYHRDDGQLT